MKTRENATRTIRLSAGGMAAIAALFCTSIAMPVAAGGGNDIDWIGPDSGLWNDAANWNPMTVPNGAFDVFIENGTTPIQNINATVDTLTINSSSGLDMLNVGLTIGGGMIDNDGQILINLNSGFNAFLDFSSNATLTGSGEIFINGDNTNDRIQGAVNSVVTQAASHTIRGAGDIDVELINNGTVIADQNGPGDYSLLRLDGGMKTNNNLMTTDNGAVLQFNGTTLDNTSGDIVADDGDVLITNSNIIGGNLVSSAGSKIQITTASGLTNPTITANSLLSMLAVVTTIDGSTLTNNGTIVMNELSGFNAALTIDGNIDLVGSGEIFINGDNTNDRIETTAGSLLTQAASHTIRGAGDIDAEFVNNGTVIADQNQPMDYALLRMDGGMKTNNNLMITDNGAVLQFNNTTLDNTNGDIVADDGDVLITNSSIDAGNLTSSLGSKIQITAASTLTNPTLTANSLLTTLNIITTVDGSTFTNDGMVVLNEASGFDAALSIDGNIDLVGSGEIFLNGDNVSDRIETTVDSVLTQAASHTIRGAGDIDAEFVNNGTVIADQNGPEDYALLRLDGNTKTNNNLITTDNGAVLQLNSTTIENSSGDIVAADGNVTITNSAINGGVLESELGSQFFVGSASTLTDVTLTEGSFLGTGDIILTLGGSTFVNDGFVNMNQGSGFDAALNVPSDMMILGDGEIYVEGDNNSDRIDIATGMTLTNGPEHTIRYLIGSLNGNIENLGTIVVDDFMRVVNAANGNDLDLPGGTLAGGGTVDAAAVNNTSGVVSPGNSAGTLTIDGDYNQSSGAALQIELGGLDSGVDSDLLVVTGNASLGGALVLQSTNGFIPDPGDSITILTADSISGEFVRILPAQEFCNLGFTITYTATTVEVTVFDAVSTDEFSFFNGTLIGGTLNDLIDSDDSRVRARSEFGFLSSEPNVLELRAGFTTVASPNELTIIFEGRVNNPNASVRVRMRNWDTNSFNQVDAFTMPTPNVDVRRLITGIPADDFIRSSDGKMEVAVRQVVIATFSLSGFISSFDQLQVCGSG